MTAEDKKAILILADTANACAERLTLATAELATLRKVAEAITWLEANGASLYHASQPDMGNYNWRVSHPLIPSSRRVRGRTPLEAIAEARAALAKLDAAP